MMEWVHQEGKKSKFPSSLHWAGVNDWQTQFTKSTTPADLQVPHHSDLQLAYSPLAAEQVEHIRGGVLCSARR